jgi:hypothetical protein
MTPTGLEHTAKSPEKTAVRQSRGTESGTPDADLARVVAAWPNLSPARRAAVLHLVDGAEPC